MPTLAERILLVRAQMRTDRANDDIPAFDPTNAQAAQAHINYLNTLCGVDARLPSFELETITIRKIKVIPPAQ